MRSSIAIVSVVGVIGCNGAGGGGPARQEAIDAAAAPPGWNAPPRTDAIPPAPLDANLALDAPLRRGPVPDFGPVTQAQIPPPPISGGTLIVLGNGGTAVASDPDRDRIYVVDLARRRLTATVALEPGDEPGRLTEDADRRVHVALRRGGAVVTIDPRSGELLARRDVCSAPRGIAYDRAGDVVYVACAGGELVTLPAGGGAATRRLQIERDLRDVVVGSDRLYVSRFRTAEVLVLDDAGRVVQRLTPPSTGPAPVALAPSPPPDAGRDGGVSASPAVAWRMIPMLGGVALAHQRGSDGEVGTQPGGYGGTCNGVVEGVVTAMRSGSPTRSISFSNVVLPVDLATSRDGVRMALVAAGNGHLQPFPQVMVWRSDSLPQVGCLPPPSDVSDPPPRLRPDAGPPDDELPDPVTLEQPQGEAIALAFEPKGNIIVQTREPAALVLVTQRGAPKIPLSSESRADTGHAIFHTNSGAGVACASCHPEGGEDARVWRFARLGPRRTQSLRGGVLATAPFHWDGSLPDLAHLMDEVFVGRMSGPRLASTHLDALGRWLDSIPELPMAGGADAAAVARGRALFESPKVGCATCHSGPQLTNNANADVGTGGSFQVPSLRGVMWRPPFMHDGCARTMLDRFTKCGARDDKHGVTSTLEARDLADLEAYLGSL